MCNYYKDAPLWRLDLDSKPNLITCFPAWQGKYHGLSIVMKFFTRLSLLCLKASVAMLVVSDKREINETPPASHSDLARHPLPRSQNEAHAETESQSP